MNEPRLKDELYNELRRSLLSPTPFKKRQDSNKRYRGEQRGSRVFLVVSSIDNNIVYGDKNYDDNPVTVIGG